MAQLTILLFLLLSCVSPLPSHAQQHSAEPAVQQAAEQFLHFLDDNEFQLAFSQTSQINQSYLNSPLWFAKLTAVRPHLGSPLQRQVKTVSYHSGWVGLPDGEYVRISFASVFANKQDALESVVLVHEGNSWLVSSYHLR